jgi:hypothetical protein
MKTKVLFLLKKIALGSLLFCVLSLFASSSNAKVTNILLSEGFSSAIDGTFPPTNWSTDGYGYWYGSAYGIDKGTGDGGYNGSAMFNMNGVCGAENLYSPSIDASGYSGTGATVTLDFDYWWEENFYDANFGANTVTVYVTGTDGNVQLTQIYSNSDFTYDNSSSFGYNYDPFTDPSYWKHLTFTIPASSATSTMQIIFNADGSGVCGGAGNFGVDNVVVTGTLPQNISFAPAVLNFDSVAVGAQSAPLCVTLTNPSSGDVSLNSIKITGAASGEYQFSGELPSTIPANGTANVCIIFVPQGNGPQPADLNITDNSDNDPVIDITLNGVAVEPLIEIDPIGAKNTSTRMFKSAFVRLRGSLQQSLLIKNIGAGNLVIDPESYIGGDNPNQYVISRLPMNPIPAGGSDTLSVIFSPQVEGSDPAELYILSNAGNTIPPVDLLGIGVLPRIVFTPNLLLFDSVGIGETVCKTITISNPGSDTLQLVRNYLSSNDGDFTLNALSSEKSFIPPNQSANVTICFTPKQQGTRQARFTVATNIPTTFDTPAQDTGFISVDITGTGVPFGKLAFGIGGKGTLDSSLIGTQVCAMDTITNIGQADLIVTSAIISGAQASDFSISGVTLPFHVPPQTSVIVNVCATPDLRGLRQGMLTITATTNDQTINGTVPLAVYGEIACAAPTPLALFNAVKVVKNTLDTESVTIANCGDLPAIYTGTVTGDGYSILSPAAGVSGTISPGGTIVYQVLFNPTSIGVKNGSLDISSSNITTINVPLTGEGACAALTEQTPTVPQTGVGATNTFDVIITNNGNYDWTPNNAVMTPPDVYSVVSITPSSIPAGGTGDVKIQFAPTAIGTANAELTFPNSGPCQDAAVVIDFSGQGIVNAVQPTVTADGFSLGQNYPNPFVNSTTFNYSIPNNEEDIIKITLTDMTGKTVKTLISGAVSGGDHSVTFDASQLSSGTYVYTLESGATRLSKVLVLSK